MRNIVIIKELPGNNISFQVNLKPNSKLDKLKVENGILNLNIKALPVDGKANEYLIKLLSKKFKIVKSDILIIKGHKSKKKVILFKNFTSDSLKMLLSDYI